MLPKHFRRLFSQDLSIDLGTANTLIYMRGQGIVLNEPSVVAIQHDPRAGGKICTAVGIEAKKMLGRTPHGLTTVRPLRDGVIADLHETEEMLERFIAKVHKNRLFFKKPHPRRILLCVPYGATAVEKRALRDAAIHAGASEAYLIREPMAAAIGAGMPVDEPSGSMVLDIGGGTSEVAVMSLNGVVYANSVRIGGDHFDEAIINYVRRNYGMVIGEPTAERIKQEIGLAFPSSEILEAEVRGRNFTEGIPRTFSLTSNEILEALQEPLSGIVSAVRLALESTPPELAADIAERGIVITGGGALLRNIDKLIHAETALNTIIADDPLTCVARGGGKALEMMDVYGTHIFGIE